MGVTKVIALAGNPNVGKSTLFNALTGMKQHTGNWAGKTVALARGQCRSEKQVYTLVDLPGTYSLMAHSAEEELARDFLCFDRVDAAIVVCDATCLERNLNLVLQTMEICPRVLVCVNLLDEARRKGIRVDLPRLAERLGVPVVGTVAREKKSLDALLRALDEEMEREGERAAYAVAYPAEIESAVETIRPKLEALGTGNMNPRWLSLKILEQDRLLLGKAEQHLGLALPGAANAEAGEKLKDAMVGAIVRAAENISRETLTYETAEYARRDRQLDRLFTSRLSGYPVMLALLTLIFWITITGANLPSRWLSAGLFRIQEWLTGLFVFLDAPEWLHGALVLGAYRVLAWVVSVMLPPMAIFFPLFTLLEDAGYLPRVAYNLDKPFKRCCACGKQALCMAMGFGCNAVGVTGCRIIDSPRERLLAVLTNSFVPCNGRFPTLIAVITMFFVGTDRGAGASILSALLLTGTIVLGIAATFAATKLLSATVLRGMPSSFTLELPPYRRPQFGRVILRSVLDRTLFVMGRAAAVAAPAGLVIWLMANVQPGGISLLSRCAVFLDPLGRLMGLDGVILMAFILGLPANEIVLPIAIMAYMAQGSLTDMGSLVELRAILEAKGWTAATGMSMILFSLMHWPCSTTLLTIKKETGSRKWAALAFALPTAAGMALCVLFTAAVRLLGG